MAIPTFGLLTYLDFLNPSCFTPGGTTVNDLSPQNNDWTLASTSYTYNSTYGSLDITPGNYMYCNNVNILSGFNVPFTISFWFKPTPSNPADLYLFYNGGYPSNWMEIDTRSSSFFRIIRQGTNIDTAPGTLTLNQYNNITVTYNGTNGEIYVDNVFQMSTGSPFNFIQSGGYPGFDLPNRYTGTGAPDVALVTIYDYELTTSQRNDLYDVGYNRFFGPPGPTPYNGKVGGRQFGGKIAG